MMQVGRNLTDPLDGFLRGKRWLILDRDQKFHTVSRLARARRNRCRSAAAPFTESERLCRKVCFVGQERVPESDGLLR